MTEKAFKEERLTRAITAAGTVSPGCDTNVDIVREK